MLIGGLLGGIMVMTTIILAPKIGAVALVSSLLAGQLICSIVLDHQGWVGFSIHPVNGMRIFGILLLISGVYLINRF
jgi:transporter family-2 protein